MEKSLRGAAIWDEVKDRLKKVRSGPVRRPAAAHLHRPRSGCGARRILLMDEATSALDPISTSKIEDLIADLKNSYTIVIVTHNMQQATRMSDQCAFFLHGEMVECGDTRADLLRAQGQAHRGLHHRTVWLRRVWNMRKTFDAELLELGERLTVMANQVQNSIDVVTRLPHQWGRGGGQGGH